MAYFKKSPWVIHYDGSSCNGCDIEIWACMTPVYDIERLGVINTGNPKHADILLITGSVNEQNKEAVRNIYAQMPDPKAVVAVGVCATSGGIFADCYNVRSGVDKILPVDVYVPGCAARPESIIDGLNEARRVLEEKYQQLESMLAGLHDIIIEEATIEDAPEILALQKIAFQSEAEIYNDFSIAPLKQTLQELQDDFKTRTFLKAVMNKKIVGSVRSYMEQDTCYIARLIVNPIYQHHGIGKKLMEATEKHFAQAQTFQIHTGYKSKRNIYFYQNLKYKIFKRQKLPDNQERVFMEKSAHKT